MVEAWIPIKAPAAYESGYRRLATASAAFGKEIVASQVKVKEKGKEKEKSPTSQNERDNVYYLLSVAGDSLCSSVRGDDKKHANCINPSHCIFPDIDLHQVDASSLLVSGLIMHNEFQQISCKVLGHPKRYFRPRVVRKTVPGPQVYHMLSNASQQEPKSYSQPFAVPQILDWEYGYWNIPYGVFSVDKDGDRFNRDTMARLWVLWQDLSRSIKKGRMGWVGACLPLDENSRHNIDLMEMEKSNSIDEWFKAFESNAWDGSMRIYCFGHAVARIWALLFVLSEKLTRSGLEWFDSADTLAICA